MTSPFWPFVLGTAVGIATTLLLRWLISAGVPPPATP
ncbi:hypothetical protein NRB20_38140 [Nocardia sp. RB20]|uniref:Uncharacterized protein n=1 Tax=Nocardia macrotermitis TaxID=2585198 RepID=A0A7K0D4N3_9NOCA|nr:hypothetical protein [Nocardia macrotermitis]